MQCSFFDAGRSEAKVDIGIPAMMGIQCTEKCRYQFLLTTETLPSDSMIPSEVEVVKIPAPRLLDMNEHYKEED